MASNPDPTAVVPVLPFTLALREDLAALQRSWLWLLILGIALIVVGVLALGSAFLATLATVLVAGCFLVAGGVLHIAGAFWTRSWGGFFLVLLAGVLHLALGFLILNHPAEAAIVYTLLLAVFFFVEGLFRIIGALVGRFHHWVWVLVSGIITLLLGVFIWRQWPLSGLWVIGLFVGIDLIFSGWSFVALALAVRTLPSPST